MKIQKPTVCRIVEVTLAHEDGRRVKRPAVIVEAFGTSLINLKVFLDPANDGDKVKNQEGCVLPAHAAETMNLLSAPYDAAGEVVGSWRYPPVSKDEIELPAVEAAPAVDVPASA